MVKKLTAIKEGDRVKVINPKFISIWNNGQPRVGYINNLEDITKAVSHKYKKEIIELVKTVFNEERIPSVYDHDVGNILNSIVIPGISKVLAYSVVKKNMREGAERQIFYMSEEELSKNWEVPKKDGIYSVGATKTCKTGLYYGSSSYYDSYGGGEDYEPGGLSKEKTHKLLKLFGVGFFDCWIEDIDVIKVG